MPTHRAPPKKVEISPSVSSQKQQQERAHEHTNKQNDHMSRSIVAG